MADQEAPRYCLKCGSELVERERQLGSHYNTASGEKIIDSMLERICPRRGRFISGGHSCFQRVADGVWYEDYGD